jgi:hypothetical protein
VTAEGAAGEHAATSANAIAKIDSGARESMRRR